jgi:pimeloyl-ACP methyl ester carboxylesterase
MSSFVLVHGAWHGSWCWAGVAAALRQAGHAVALVDLPGRAGDPRPHAAITLDDYVRRVGDVILRQDGPVVLAGHSMGGITITQVAEALPERLARLVYVTAFLPRDGESLLDFTATETATPLHDGLVGDPAAGSLTLKSADVARAAFYHCCSAADTERALAQLVPEPLAPAATPVRTSAGRFGRVPRTYIECLQDQAISLALQRRMQAALPCERVHQLDTDHSPFLSATAALAAQLAAA